MDQSREKTNSTDYSCRDIEQKLDSYLDELLDDAELHKFCLHISSCSKCDKLVSEFTYIRQLAGSLAETEVPTGIRERLRARLAQETQFRSADSPTHLRLVK